MEYLSITPVWLVSITVALFLGTVVGALLAVRNYRRWEAHLEAELKEDLQKERVKHQAEIAALFSHREPYTKRYEVTTLDSRIEQQRARYLERARSRPSAALSPAHSVTRYEHLDLMCPLNTLTPMHSLNSLSHISPAHTEERARCSVSEDPPPPSSPPPPSDSSWSQNVDNPSY